MPKNNLLLVLFSLFPVILFSQNAGKTITFDGTDDYINCGNGSSVQITTNQITMEAWINASSWRTNVYEGTIVNKEASSAGYMLRCGNNGDLNMAIGNGSTWGQIYANSTSTYMSLNKWYHVCGIYDGSTLKLYINGNLVAQGNFTGNIGNAANNLWIGSTALYSTRTFPGKIDEVRIWNTALSINTVKDWMHRQLSSSHPNYSSLKAYYPMNEGTGTTIYDASGNSNTGTMVNFAAATAWSASYAPFASTPSNCLNNLAAVWPAASSATSAQMTVKDTLSGNTYVVFGHNNAPSGYNTSNKPTTIQKRLKRYWRIETEGSSLSGQIYFDYSGMDTSGFFSFRLLVDNDTNFSNANPVAGIKKGNYIIHFPNITFQDSFFYTIGAFDFQAPTVETKSIDEVKAFTAKVSGRVIEDGGYTTTRGICWSTSPNPDTSLATKIISGTGAGSFQVNISGLAQNTTYHVRAFAFNSLGLVYGGDSSFTTKAALIPTVLTAGYTTLYTDSVLYKGNVTADGNVSVTERGFVWATSPNPTTALSTKLIKGSGTGNFTGMITGLTPGTTYHIRAYAINSVGTTYGADSTFTALPISVPTVITGATSNILGYSAKVAGQVTFDGRRPVTDKGICWSTSANPTVSLSTKTNEGPGTGSFTSTLSGLAPNTTYHVRAYATNAVGTAYGADSTFLTAAPPVLLINNINSVSYYSANCSATVVSDGRLPVTARGVCWDTTANPDIIRSNKKAYGTGTGTFNAPMTGLLPNTTYHVRAYAINLVDTSYSADSTFKTLKTYPPTVSTKAVTNITANSANCGGNVTADGGATVTLRGIVWDTKPNPRAYLSTKTNNGNGLGAFNSVMTGLSRGTTYHVRAYAVNNVDTGYGGDSIFKTLDAPTVTTDVVSGISGNSAQCGGTVTADGGSAVIRRGVCWSTTPNPTARLGTKTTDGFGMGHFNSTLTFLVTGTKYYVRAYAINAIDTAYGNEVNFTTPSAAVVTTDPVTSITGSSAVSGGNVLSGDNVSEKGVVWSKFPNPTIALTTKTSDGSGTGAFTSNITGLERNTTYHVRAWATNPVGTVYGADIAFTTATSPTVTTAPLTVTSSSSVQGGGNVTADGGMAVNDRGLCWSTSPNPTVLMNKTSDGSGTGPFTSIITGLTPYVTYYIRAFAINGVDTAYGSEKSILINAPIAQTGTSSNITTTEADISGLANAKGIFTSFSFEYGTDTTYGLTIPGVPASGSDTNEETITAHLTGLSHNTTYHYRLVAENAHGTAYGADSGFKTVIDIGMKENNLRQKVVISRAGNIINIQLTNNESQSFQVRVTDMLGKDLLNKSGQGTLFFELPKSKSDYLLQVILGNEVLTEKIFSR